MWLSSLLSGWSSYKGLKRSAALGYLLLWETHLWRFGTSSRCLYCMCFSFDPVVQPTPNILYARAVSPSVWPAEAHANCHASSTAQPSVMKCLTKHTACILQMSVPTRFLPTNFEQHSCRQSCHLDPSYHCYCSRIGIDNSSCTVALKLLHRVAGQQQA